mmetsp:Transcript_4187/g.7836  ORF Transcript_4187/g.7836 Transcript_4187/m.7836 type:complete len:202 (-) Transcript_4187:312-917(-)
MNFNGTSLALNSRKPRRCFSDGCRMLRRWPPHSRAWRLQLALVLPRASLEGAATAKAVSWLDSNPAGLPRLPLPCRPNLKPRKTPRLFSWACLATASSGNSTSPCTDLARSLPRCSSCLSPRLCWGSLGTAARRQKHWSTQVAWRWPLVAGSQRCCWSPLGPRGDSSGLGLAWLCAGLRGGITLRRSRSGALLTPSACARR